MRRNLVLHFFRINSTHNFSKHVLTNVCSLSVLSLQRLLLYSAGRTEKCILHA